MSRIDYCNSLLVGLPQYLIKRLQGIQNTAARSILRTSRSEHISPSRTFTGCLSIGESCTRLLLYVILHYLVLALNTCPDLTHVYTPARSLRSSSDTCILNTLNVKLKSYGQHSFAYYGPTTWNSLPLALRHQQESDCFKRALKTYVFSELM